ncbi:MAG: restriction endonuclease-like protein [Chloroflexaceae bacterium]|jgi:large subunit ribosomal protein MRP49|nr:restriction endonuclease-like protein [Chloroflexaceae bacterium]
MLLLLNNQPFPEAASVNEWQPLELACLPPEGAALELRVGADSLEPFLRPGDPTWRWAWNPQNAVGRFVVTVRATWPDGGMQELRAALEVLPRKIDQERYQLLLDDLQTQAQALAYALHGGTAGGSTPPHSAERRTMLEEHAILFGEEFAALERAIARISTRPHTGLRPTEEQVELAQVQSFAEIRDWRVEIDSLTPDAAQSLTRHSSLVTRHSSLVTRHSSLASPDTYENRLLKRLLATLWQRLRLLESLATQEGVAGRMIAERCAAVAPRLRELRALPFLTEVGPLSRFHGPSQVTQRDPSYRTVYRYWQLLRRRPMLDLHGPFELPLHELPRLYEYWCVVRMAQALLALPDCQVLEQQLLAPETNTSFTLSLREEAPLLTLAWHNTTLRLRYQPRYRPLQIADCRLQIDRTENQEPEIDYNRQSPIANRQSPGSLDRHTRVPDIVVEIEPAKGQRSLLVFDAKYRLDASGGVPEDALADAYSYLGSIGRSDGSRAAQTVLLLYPGQRQPEWYPSGVGALPLLPGGGNELERWLAEQLVKREA